MGALSWQHLLIVLIIVLVLFGGSRIAGLGKSTGRALREFKEETKGLGGNKDDSEPEQITPKDTHTTSYTVDENRTQQSSPETRREV